MAITSRHFPSGDGSARMSVAAQAADHDPQFATFGGTANDDTLVGTNYDDVISGLDGDDLLLGRGGHDLVDGGGGADRLRGARGADTLNGGLGDDQINGGLGLDSLTGGGGLDIFFYRRELDSIPSEVDVITDFDKHNELIDLSAVDAVRGGITNEAFTFIGTGPFTAPGQVRVIAGPVRGSLTIEMNTKGFNDAEMQIVVLDVNRAAITAADFVL